MPDFRKKDLNIFSVDIDSVKKIKIKQGKKNIGYTEAMKNEIGIHPTEREVNQRC